MGLSVSCVRINVMLIPENTIWKLIKENGKRQNVAIATPTTGITWNNKLINKKANVRALCICFRHTIEAHFLYFKKEYGLLKEAIQHHDGLAIVAVNLTVSYHRFIKFKVLHLNTVVSNTLRTVVCRSRAKRSPLALNLKRSSWSRA